MKKIYIKTTEACNLQCSHCYIGDNRNIKLFFNEDITIEYLKKCIGKKLFRENDMYISFHGGEPFLCPIEKIEKVCKAFPAATIDATSNLLLCTDKHIELIKKYFGDKTPFIKTSWDYLIRFRDESEEKAWENKVRTLLENGISVKVNICLTKLLIENISPEWLIEKFSILGIRELHFERLTANTTYNKKLLAGYSDIDNWLLELYRHNNNRLEIDNFTDLILAANNIYIDCRKRECMCNVMTINANGTIGGCPNSSIADFWTDIYSEPSGIYEKQLELIKKEQKRNRKCYYCELFKICNGDCHQLSWEGDICPAPKKLITRIKNDLEKKKTIIIPDESV